MTWKWNETMAIYLVYIRTGSSAICTISAHVVFGPWFGSNSAAICFVILNLAAKWKDQSRKLRTWFDNVDCNSGLRQPIKSASAKELWTRVDHGWAKLIMLVAMHYESLLGWVQRPLWWKSVRSAAGRRSCGQCRKTFWLLTGASSVTQGRLRSSLGSLTRCLSHSLSTLWGHSSAMTIK